MSFWQHSRSQVGDSFVTLSLFVAVLVTLFTLVTVLDDEMPMFHSYMQIQ